MSQDRLHQIRRDVLGTELAGRECAGRLTDANLRLQAPTGGPGRSCGVNDEVTHCDDQWNAVDGRPAMGASLAGRCSAAPAG